MGAFLYQAQHDGDCISCQHAFAYNDRCHAKEDAGYPFVSHSQRLERSDGGNVSEQKNQQAGYHVESRYQNHQTQDNQQIKVNEIQPVIYVCK